MFHTHFFFSCVFILTTQPLGCLTFFVWVCLSDLQSKLDRHQPESVLPDPSNNIPEQNQVLE